MERVAVPVVVSVDAAVADGTLALLRSMFYHNNAKNVEVHMVIPDAKTQTYFESLIQQSSCLLLHETSIHFHTLESSNTVVAPALVFIEKNMRVVDTKSKHILNMMNFARFTLAHILPSRLDWIVYLDVDMIVQADIHDLYTTAVDLCHTDGTYFAAVQEDKTYDFNAGMFCTSLEYWRQRDVCGQCLQWMEKHKAAKDGLFQWGTQPILNLVFPQYSKLERKWNFLGLGNGREQYAPDMVDAQSILHWNGNIKPWNTKAAYRLRWERWRTDKDDRAVKDERPVLCTEGRSAQATNAVIDVVVCGDWAVRFGVVAVLNSCLAYATDQGKLRFHVLHPCDDIALAPYVKQHVHFHMDTACAASATWTYLDNSSLKFYAVPKHDEDVISSTMRVVGNAAQKYIENVMNFARFVIADVVTDCDVVVYLDTDVIVHHDLTELKAHCCTFSDDSYFAAVHINDEERFNAGVFVTSLNKWREVNVKQRAFDIMVAHKNSANGLFKLGTQPIMHRLFPKYTRVDNVWNTWSLGSNDKLNKSSLDKAKILHWTGTAKPWTVNGYYKALWARHAPFEACTTFQDCVRWRMENDRNPHLLTLEDKVKSRALAESVGVPLPRCLFSLEDLEKYDPRILTSVDPFIKCVIKTNHLAGGQGLKKLSKPEDVPSASEVHRVFRPLLDKRWSVRCPRHQVQWASRAVEPRLTAEEWIVDELEPDQGWCYDYKVFVFDGHPALVAVYDSRNGGDPKRRLYTTDWLELECHDKQPELPKPIPRPQCLLPLLDYAATMGKGVDFVRVDFYVARNRGPVFGECACYPAGEPGMTLTDQQSSWLAEMWKSTRARMGLPC